MHAQGSAHPGQNRLLRLAGSARRQKSEQAIESAVATTFDAAEIGLRAILSRSSASGALRLDAHIDAHDVVLVHAGDAYNGHLRLAIVGYARGAPAQRSPLIPLDIHFITADRDKALQEGINFTQDVNFAPTIQYLRLIVFDRGSDTIGSLTMPVPGVRGQPN